MKIAVLTTQTTHHTKYVMDIMSKYPDVFCVLETTGVKPPFETHHAFEETRDNYEKNLFFGGKDIGISDITRSIEAQNINESSVLDALMHFNPDVVIDFGTRKVTAPIIKAFAGRIYNLHGGNPEQYRGLDSHLWAIYHNDFSNVATCLHVMNESLDDGAIVDVQPVSLSGLNDISELRASNTQLCVQMSLTLLDGINSGRNVPVRPQTGKGRYYSFMPRVLKDICVRNFQKRTGTK